MNLVMGPSKRFIGQVRTDLLNNLRERSPELERMAGQFLNQTSGMKIVSFLEQRITPPFSKLVSCTHNRLFTATDH